MDPKSIQASSSADMFASTLASLALAVAALPPSSPPVSPHSDLFHTTLAPKPSHSWTELLLVLKLVWTSPERVPAEEMGGVELVRQLWVRVGSVKLGALEGEDKKEALEWLFALLLATKRLRAMMDDRE